MSYIPLRNHSPYSLLEGALFMGPLIQSVKSWGLEAVGLADSGHLFGAMEFSGRCLKEGLFPVLGAQISVFTEGKSYPMVLYVQNQKGYENLCALITCSTVGQPLELRESVTLTQLETYEQGLLALSGGFKGPLDSLLQQDNPDAARRVLESLGAIFKDRFYIEINRYPSLKRSQNIEDQLVDWAYAKSLPLIATNQAFFLNPEDFKAHDVLRCIAMGRYVAEEDRPTSAPDYALKSAAEMKELFYDLPEALANTEHLYRRVGFILRESKPILPSFPCPDPAQTFVLESQKGLEQRLSKKKVDSEGTQVYQQRLQYEIDVIQKMGFGGYFLIVSDFIRWAKAHKIPVGPGRGSGASSLVAFALNITDVDPIEFDLLFERFLNPERVSLPDFDVDFCQERRDEVIAYVAHKYGQEHVAHIITFGTLQARAVLRDVGRVLQMPYSQVDRICKLIPHQPAHPVSLKEALKVEPQLARMQAEDAQVQLLMELGQKLEGLYRHASTHAAGVIISDAPLCKIVPLYQEQEGTLPAVEFSMKYAEAAGLIKFDFLGLKTLTVLQETLNLLEKKGIVLQLETLPLDDAKTFELLCRVETVGIFQLESAGMSEVLRQLQPERFEEIVALVALYRPGPMDDIPRYLACRHGREKVHYEYDCLQSILTNTFGVMVYQEQVLQIAQVLAGYSLGEADLLRRAMGKKIKAEMDAQREKFIQGTLDRHKGERQIASSLFDQIAKFAGYAFPKAHSVPYAMISYQTAYMKANYGVEFFIALMNCDIHNTDKLRTFSLEVRRMGIELLPPDVNMSQALFSSPGTGQIRYGLAALKNVGLASMEKITQQVRPFKSLEDFLSRCAPYLNKKNLEGLIAAGALDSLCAARHQLMYSVERLLKGVSSSGPSLFSDQPVPLQLTQCPAWSSFQALEFERQAVGFYLSSHPLQEYDFAQSSVQDLPILSQDEDILKEKIQQGACFQMIGMVMEIKEKSGKSGQKYAFMTCSDPSGSYEVTAFSGVLSRVRDMLTQGQALVLKIQGKIEGEGIKLWLQDANVLAAVEKVYHYPISSVQEVASLHQILQKLGPGPGKFILILQTPEAKIFMALVQGYAIPKGLLEEFKKS